MKRLFAFGDSFSQYSWPMWPEILGQGFDETRNYGAPGVGNFFIFYRLVRCLTEHNIGKDDTVVVQWSSPSRFDYIRGDNWGTCGDQSADLFRNKQDIELLNNDGMSALRSLTYMNAAAKMLNETGCRWRFAFLTHYAKVYEDTHHDEFGANLRHTVVWQEYERLRKTLKQHIANFVTESLATYFHYKYRNGKQRLLSCKTADGNEFVDSHPLPNDSFAWVRDCLQFDDIDLNKLEFYAIEATKKVISRTHNDTYEDRTFFDFFDEMNQVKGVKPMIKDYLI